MGRSNTHVLVVLESALQQLARNSLYNNRACSISLWCKSEQAFARVAIKVWRKDPKLTACSHAETTTYWNDTFTTSVIVAAYLTIGHTIYGHRRMHVGVNGKVVFQHLGVSNIQCLQYMAGEDWDKEVNWERSNCVAGGSGNKSRHVCMKCNHLQLNDRWLSSSKFFFIMLIYCFLPSSLSHSSFLTSSFLLLCCMHEEPASSSSRCVMHNVKEIGPLSCCPGCRQAEETVVYVLHVLVIA